MKPVFKPINAGNSGVKDMPLVLPDVDACPLCGIFWVILVKDCDTRWEKTPRSVQPVALRGDGITESIAQKLHWKCLRCGYIHKHNASGLT